jgi:hypothetical protein
VADKAGVFAAGIALTAAVEAAVADQASQFIGAFAAVGAVVALFHAAGIAGPADSAPVVDALAAEPAYGTVFIVHIAVSAFRAVAAVFHGAFDAHVALFAVVVRAISAGSADETSFRFVDSKALAAALAGHIVVQMALQTEMFRALRAFAAAFVAASALLAELDINTAGAAVPAVAFCLDGAVDAHVAVLAPLDVGLARAAFLAVMLVAAVGIAFCAAAAVVAEPVVIAIRAAVYAILAVLIVGMHVSLMSQRQTADEHDDSKKNTQKFSCLTFHQNTSFPKTLEITCVKQCPQHDFFRSGTYEPSATNAV